MPSTVCAIRLVVAECHAHAPSDVCGRLAEDAHPRAVFVAKCVELVVEWLLAFHTREDHGRCAVVLQMDGGDVETEDGAQVELKLAEVGAV